MLSNNNTTNNNNSNNKTINNSNKTKSSIEIINDDLPPSSNNITHYNQHQQQINNSHKKSLGNDFEALNYLKKRLLEETFDLPISSNSSHSSPNSTSPLSLSSSSLSPPHNNNNNSNNNNNNSNNNINNNNSNNNNNYNNGINNRASPKLSADSIEKKNTEPKSFIYSHGSIESLPCISQPHYPHPLVPPHFNNNQSNHNHHNHIHNTNSNNNNNNNNNNNSPLLKSAPSISTSTSFTDLQQLIKKAQSNEAAHPPNENPSCPKCNVPATRRHDKRRWWCKPCTKSFTPFRKEKRLSNDELLSNVAPQCGRCFNQATRKHDKRRWWCKFCKKPFTPTHFNLTESQNSIYVMGTPKFQANVVNSNHDSIKSLLNPDSNSELPISKKQKHSDDEHDEHADDEHDYEDELEIDEHDDIDIDDEIQTLNNLNKFNNINELKSNIINQQQLQQNNKNLNNSQNNINNNNSQNNNNNNNNQNNHNNNTSNPHMFLYQNTKLTNSYDIIDSEFMKEGFLNVSHGSHKSTPSISPLNSSPSHPTTCNNSAKQSQPNHYNNNNNNNNNSFNPISVLPKSINSNNNNNNLNNSNNNNEKERDIVGVSSITESININFDQIHRLKQQQLQQSHNNRKSKSPSEIILDNAVDTVIQLNGQEKTPSVILEWFEHSHPEIFDQMLLIMNNKNKFINK